jgi:hypothetical protein
VRRWPSARVHDESTVLTGVFEISSMFFSNLGLFFCEENVLEFGAYAP